MYRRRYESHLTRIADSLATLIGDYVTGLTHIDRIAARAKDPGRFEAKAKKAIDGRLKYASPLTQIQDQIGARVIVFYKDDVARVASRVERYFKPVERQDLVPDSEWEFGYFGRHWIFALPLDVVPSGVDSSECPRFFELQVKTLYQHAWSEANHDLGYKVVGEVSSDQLRRFAYASAQSWGADRVFEELRAEILGETSVRDER